MYARWNRVTALIGGTECIRDLSEGGESEYLPKFPNETDADFAWRLKNAVLYPLFREMADGMAGRLFKTAPTEDVNLEGFIIDDIDRRGHNLEWFAKKCARELMRYGMCHIVIDHPPAPNLTDEEGNARRPNLQEEQELGLRPYWKTIHPPSVIGASRDVVGGTEILKSFRWESVFVEENEDYDHDTITKVYEYKLEGGKAVLNEYESKDGSEFGKPIATTPIIKANGENLGRLPIVTIYAEEDKFMDCTLPLQGVIDLNITHFQSTSDQRRILHLCRFGNLKFTGLQSALNDTELAEVFKPNSVLQFTGEAGDADWIICPSDGVEAGERDLKNIEEQAETVGLRLVSKRPQATATAEVLDDTRETSPLYDISVNLENGLNSAVGITAEWLGSQDGGVINLDKSATIIADDDLKAKFLNDLDMRQRIPTKVMFEEAQASGLMSKTYTPEELEKMLGEEYPEGGVVLGGVDPNAPPPQDADA